VPRGAWWEVEHRENRLIGRDSPALHPARIILDITEQTQTRYRCYNSPVLVVPKSTPLVPSAKLYSEPEAFCARACENCAAPDTSSSPRSTGRLQLI